MVRNCFAREEGERLILCGGVPRRWLETGNPVAFGPAPTTFGTISIEVRLLANGALYEVAVTWEANWHASPPPIEVRLPGHPAVTARTGRNRVLITEEASP